MAVRINTKGIFDIGRERTLFSASSVGAENLYQDYDVSSDGQRFVVVQNVDAGETPKITVVQNWIKKFEGQK
jgi:hypothetical protein